MTRTSSTDDIGDDVVMRGCNAHENRAEHPSSSGSDIRKREATNTIRVSPTGCGERLAQLTSQKGHSERNKLSMQNKPMNTPRSLEKTQESQTRESRTRFGHQQTKISTIREFKISTKNWCTITNH